MLVLRYKVNYLILFITLNISLVFSSDEQCSVKSDKSDCHGNTVDNKYTEELNVRYQKYYDKIRIAKEKYVPCNNTKCNCYTNVIVDDLKPFKTNGISENDIQGVLTKGTKYQIINNRLYRDKNCMFPSRCKGIDYFLSKLVSKLPNMELIINTRDWPQISTHQEPIAPVFSFSKTNEYRDIMYPVWAFWEGGPAIGLYPTGIGRWDLHRDQLSKVAINKPWEEKGTIAFFRGSRTSAERDALILLSRENPGIVDAKYTKNQAWKSDADTLNKPPADEATFQEHCNYKYLFNFRGVAASIRLKHLFVCKSLVFHVGNEWKEFFYDSLKPWIHYIPVDANASKEELQELIQFAMNNDDIAQEIAAHGYEMIWDNLRLKDVSCYWKKLLKRYAKLLTYEPKLDAELKEIRSN